MEHFGALFPRRKFLTTSIVTTTCLSLASVVIPCLFHSTTVLAVDDDFDPTKAMGLPKQTQYDSFEIREEKERLLARAFALPQAERNRLLKLAYSLPQNDIRRADLLVAVIKHYNNYGDAGASSGYLYARDFSYDSLYAEEALEILESAYYHKQRKSYKQASYQLTDHSFITAAKELIAVGKLDEAAQELTWLCRELIPNPICDRTNNIWKVGHPNPAQLAKLALEATKEIKKVGPPSHALALDFRITGMKFKQAGYFNEAVEAFKKALEIDDQCFPDKTIYCHDRNHPAQLKLKFKYCLMSEVNDSYPILTDCELLADAYMNAAKYQKAAQIYSRAIATIAAISRKFPGREELFTCRSSTLNRGLETAMHRAAQSARW